MANDSNTPRGPRQSRREFLWTTGTVGASVVLGLASANGVERSFRWLDPDADAPVDYRATLSRLAASLTPGQRRALILPADHPSRQITNTVAIFRGPHIGTLLGAEQVDAVRDLYRSMTSESGRSDLANTMGLEGLLEGCVLAFYGDPDDGRAHTLISGGHILLRGGGPSSSGTVFGGPIAYGQQIGNGRFRVEGNAFAFHSDHANAFHAALTPAQQARSLRPAPPSEFVVQAQGASGRFTGVTVGETSDAAQAAARELVDAVLSTFDDEGRRDARSCIDHNGGVQALHVTFYESQGYYADGAVYANLPPEERARREPAYWQVWRVEGPGTVIHFKGAPHVHAYVNIVRDPSRQNVGEVIARTDELLEGDALRPLIEAAIRSATGEALAFHPPGEVTGRFCPGEISTGLAWTLDPYGNALAVATIRGDAMAEPLRRSLAAQGVRPGPDERVRVGLSSYSASREDLFGRPDDVETGSVLLREAIIEHLRRQGLRAQRTGPRRDQANDPIRFT